MRTSLKTRFSVLAMLAMAVLLVPVLPAHADPPVFDPAALLGTGKDAITTFIVSVAPVVIGLVILATGFKKVVSYVKKMFKSA